MSERRTSDTSRTTVDAPFGGQRRRFRLRIGEIGELERLCGAGIGEIMLRLAGHRFKGADIRETVRLGLVGGGTSEPESTALTLLYIDNDVPLGEHMQLAADIISAAVSGVSAASDASGNGDGERSDDPATSPPSTSPGAQSASIPTGSTA